MSGTLPFSGTIPLDDQGEIMAIVQNSFMKSLFFGQIREDLIFPYPRFPAESAESVRMMIDAIERFKSAKIYGEIMN